MCTWHFINPANPQTCCISYSWRHRVSINPMRYIFSGLPELKGTAIILLSKFVLNIFQLYIPLFRSTIISRKLKWVRLLSILFGSTGSNWPPFDESPDKPPPPRLDTAHLIGQNPLVAMPAVILSISPTDSISIYDTLNDEKYWYPFYLIDNKPTMRFQIAPWMSILERFYVV